MEIITTQFIKNDGIMCSNEARTDERHLTPTERERVSWEIKLNLKKKKEGAQRGGANG